MTFLLLALACNSGKSGSADDGNPRIRITEPDASSEVSGCFTLVTDVSNFTLVNPVDENEPVDGHGHYHVEFGTRYFDCEESTCDIAITNTEAGDVDVSAVLVGNDHADLLDEHGDPVMDTRTFSYTGEDCPAG